MDMWFDYINLVFACSTVFWNVAIALFYLKLPCSFWSSPFSSLLDNNYTAFIRGMCHELQDVCWEYKTNSQKGNQGLTGDKISQQNAYCSCRFVFSVFCVIILLLLLLLHDLCNFCLRNGNFMFACPVNIIKWICCMCCLLACVT